ncbi:DUF86 domain-containing protein [Candidatus Woesearchaeota archaeon]|nr:DUF86 domain-containing protein [Candidatus Woesearchaeota archaeon]
MKKEPLIFIEHILESIKRIESYAKDLTKERLTKNMKLQDAIIRRIEIVGEAAKNLPTDFRNKYPEIEWSDIIRTRDKVTHHYFGVDLNIVWNIVKKDLPGLKKKIKRILKECKSKE